MVDCDSGDIAYLVVDRGLLARSVVVPAQKIKEVTGEAVMVDLTEDEIYESPRYRPPGEPTVLTDLEERLGELAPDLDDIEAVFGGGFLRISRTAPQMTSKRRAEAAARSVEGIVGVNNALITDTAIAANAIPTLSNAAQREFLPSP